MRKFAFTFLLLSAATRLFALGLGNIELRSGLNQAFDARIELLSPTATEIDSLSVRLADLAAFNRAGIDRVFVLGSLRFEIVVNETGSDYIHITSSEAIREPYLNFLLEASWSGGRLFREYTVLLDPPLYDPNAGRIAVQQTPEPQTPSISTPPVDTVSTEAPPASVSTFSGDQYGPTGTTDTLWSIATRVRPDTGITVQQMMLALLRANPEAFIQNNINGLRQGQILRIPERDEILASPVQAALSEVQSQNSMWEEIRGTFAASATQRPAGSASQPSTDVTIDTSASDSELRLVSPDSDAGDTGQAAASFDSSGEGGAQIALANEQIEALSAEVRDLRSQLDQSEELIQDLQRLLELRDDELATLQQQTAAVEISEDIPETVEELSDTEIAEDTAEEVSVEVMPEEITSLALDEPDASQETPEVVEEQPAVEPDTSPPPAVAAETEAMPVETGLVDQVLGFIFGNIVLVGGALGGVMIAIAALLFIKKRKESGLDDDVIPASEFPDFESTAEETAMPDEESEIASEIDSSDEEDKTAFIGDVESEQLAEEVADTSAEQAPEAAADKAEEPEDDPLAEVNVFLAYEHFDQAEEFVRDAINGDPENLDFHSKLLEVFYSSGDKAKYEEEAKVLSELTGGEGPHWEMATIMWQEISPNRELFAEPVAGEEEAGEEAKGGGIVDLTADEDGGSEADEALDFDLGTGDTGKSAGESDEEMLDITAGGSDDVLDVTADAPGSGEEDLLDVTAAVGLDDVDEASDSTPDGENVLDITGDSGQQDEDVLDISAAPGGNEDLLDVTAHTDLESEGSEDLLDVTAAADEAPEKDIESTIKIPASGADDNSLDFDIGGNEEADEGEADKLPELEVESTMKIPAAESDDNVIDFDAAAGEESGADDDLEISLDDGKDDGGIELDLGDDTGSDTGGDDGLEISLDDSKDDGGIELDMGDDAGGDDGLEISLDDSKDDGGIELDMGDDADDGLEISLDDNKDDGGIELDMGDDAGGDDGLEISLDDSKDDGGIELDMGDDAGTDAPEISLDDDDDDDDDDDEDRTVFVPRTSDAGEQTVEDEIATKLDLAKAYVELGDNDSARAILDEVIADGNDEQRKQAEELKSQVS